MSALKAAFERAGVVDPSQRLRDLANATLAEFPRDWLSNESVAAVAATDPLYPKLKEIAVQAVKANRRNWDGAKDAVFKAVRGDAALLWALFEPYRNVAVQKLLTEASTEVIKTERETLREVGGSSHVAAGGPIPVAAPTNSHAIRQGMNAVAQVARLSMLDTFKVNGTPIGDITAQEANGWAASRERDVRFVRLLTQNLPPDKPIREFVRADEADAAYERAQEIVNV